MCVSKQTKIINFVNENIERFLCANRRKSTKHLADKLVNWGREKKRKRTEQKQKKTENKQSNLLRNKYGNLLFKLNNKIQLIRLERSFYSECDKSSPIKIKEKSSKRQRISSPYSDSNKNQQNKKNQELIHVSFIAEVAVECFYYVLPFSFHI